MFLSVQGGAKRTFSFTFLLQSHWLLRRLLSVIWGRFTVWGIGSEPASLRGPGGLISDWQCSWNYIC